MTSTSTPEKRYGPSKTYVGAGGRAGGDAGAADHNADGDAPPVVADALVAKDPPGFRAYMVYAAATFAFGASAAARPDALDHRAVAALVAFGPIAAAVGLARATGDRTDVRWPFHKDAAPKAALHACVGVALAVVPVYHALTTLLAPDDAARPYCALWGFGDRAC